MSAYVLMKLLETTPQRYDWGISVLTLGQLDKIKREIATTCLKPGECLFDIGCGTGTLAIMCALQGAAVTGIDISPGMLAIARQKALTQGLADRLKFMEMTALDLDRAFPEESFHCVTSTLVFIISVLKTSGIGGLVNHGRLILPQLAAAGVEAEEIREAVWQVLFGPDYAEDIPAFVRHGFRKTPAMHRVGFPPLQRLEMAVAWAFVISLVLLIPFLIWWPSLLLAVLTMVWGISLAMFLLVFWIPGKLGMQKSLFLGLVSVAVFLLYSWLVGYLSLPHLLGWSLGILAVCVLIGIDFAGSSPLYKSELETWAGRHGWWSSTAHATIQLEASLCTGCRLCYDVCPKGCYEIDRGDGRAKLVAVTECQTCGACVRQCPEEVLSLTKSP